MLPSAGLPSLFCHRSAAKSLQVLLAVPLEAAVLAPQRQPPCRTCPHLRKKKTNPIPLITLQRG